MSFEKTRYAVVDIGSNTVKMNIYDVTTSGGETRLNLVLTESSTIGLINYKRRRIMSDAGISRLIETLEKYKKLALAVNVEEDRIFSLATASLRNIVNASRVVSIVKAQTGLDTSLISGENEALLCFDGLKYALGGSIRTGMLCDLGGASIELLGFVDGLAVKAYSDKFGCLSLYRKFVDKVIPSKKEKRKLSRYVEERISYVDWLGSYGDTLYIVGGTARSAARLHAEMTGAPAPMSGYTISYEEFLDTVDFYTDLNKKRIETLIRLMPERLHTIVAGLLAFAEVVRRVNPKNIVISGAGLREGYLLSRIREIEENGNAEPVAEAKLELESEPDEDFDDLDDDLESEDMEDIDDIDDAEDSDISGDDIPREHSFSDQE